MIKKSISYKLSTYISLAVISIFILFIIITYFYNRQLFHENVEHQAIALSTEVNSKVNNQLISTKEIATNLSNQAVYYIQNNDAELLISKVMWRYNFLNAIHINIDSSVTATQHSFFITRSNDSLVYREGEKKIIECENEKSIVAALEGKRSSGWTEPFRCDEYNNIIVSYYSPIKKIIAPGDTMLIGEVICELSLLSLNQSINDVNTGNGFAFIVDKTGRYITHPVKEWILQRNILDLSNKVYARGDINYQNVFDNDLSGSAIVYPEILKHEKSWVYFTPIDDANWFLIFVLPYDELFSGLYLVTLRLILFAVLGILAIYFLIAYISNRLIKPLRVVTDQLNEFSKESGMPPRDAYNEIKLVSESLKSLKLWHKKQKDEHNRFVIKNNQQQQDLQQASEIQQSIIKTNFPAFPDRNEIDIHAIYKPAREVSGDLFDFFFITDEDLVFTIGDVSGKGVPAAIFMSIAQTIIKGNALYKKAKNIVNKANVEMCTNNQHQFFLTLFLGVLKLKKNELYYCNAAHTTALILKNDGTIIELNQSHGLPLGLYPDKDYVDSKIPLEKNDTIILYTDGVTELQNHTKEQFGIGRFTTFLKTLNGLRASEMAKQIETALDEYRGDTPQYDDISVLIVKYKA